MMLIRERSSWIEVGAIGILSYKPKSSWMNTTTKDVKLQLGMARTREQKFELYPSAEPKQPFMQPVVGI